MLRRHNELYSCTTVANPFDEFAVGRCTFGRIFLIESAINSVSFVIRLSGGTSVCTVCPLVPFYGAGRIPLRKLAAILYMIRMQIHFYQLSYYVLFIIWKCDFDKI